MQPTYQKHKSQLVSVIEPLNYGKSISPLSPQFGYEDSEEDLSYQTVAELSIEEVYQEVLNEIKAKKVYL